MKDLKRKIETCEKIIKTKGICSGINCCECPGYDTELGCFEPLTDFDKESKIIVEKCQEWLIQNGERNV
jgi:hypothetical protein